MPVRFKRTSGRLRRSTLRKLARKGLRKAAIMKARARTPLPKQKKFAVMGTGLPQRVMVKHKYVTKYNTTISESAITSVVIRANSLFDPEYALGGHQPMYFDQYAELYNHYTVIGSRITFTVVNTDAQEAQYAYFVVAYRDDNATLPPGTTMEGIAEQTQGRRIVSVPGGANNVYKTSLSFSAKKTFGGSVLGNPELRGSATANPNEDQYFILALRAAAPTTGGNVVISIHVEYVAIWNELKDVAQS
ncbi:capsid protein [Apis mellifera virus-12]|nr:capsid protein [Apis mellifera virus-12]QBX89305.1 capsid protein [Apis mellifera virus-12]